MYAGDRFLAANLETIRLAAIGPTDEGAFASYRMRAHRQIAELNACNEDNLYLANATLSWGGLVDEANNVLERASLCRYWDEIPPFFLGFNHYFFNQDTAKARRFIGIAAERSSDVNRAELQKISIMMEARKFKDEKLAVKYLRQQRDETKDQKLAEMLDLRLSRLKGLITLREAQAQYEQVRGHPLNNPAELVSTGILKEYPQDPMRIGYEFINGNFRLKAMKIGGMEIR